MHRANRLRRRASCALALLLIAVPAIGRAAPVLRSAEVSIAMPTPTSCDVSLTLAVDGATTVEHRLEAPEGMEVSGLVVQGAAQTGEPHTIGRTRALVLQPTQGRYTIGYRVRQDASRAHRCPLWVPNAAADGVSRPVKLRASLPPGTQPGSTMPRFSWDGSEGTATLAHLPAFVLLPFAAPGQPTGWSITAAMDATAVAVVVVAGAIWVWRRRSSGSSGSSR